MNSKELFGVSFSYSWSYVHLLHLDLEFQEGTSFTLAAAGIYSIIHHHTSLWNIWQCFKNGVSK